MATLQELVSQWETSNKFPCPQNGMDLLLLTEHNIRALNSALAAANPPIASVDDIAAVVTSLTKRGMLQYDRTTLEAQRKAKEAEAAQQAADAQAAEEARLAEEARVKREAREKRERLKLLGIVPRDRNGMPISDRTELDRVTPKKPVEQASFIKPEVWNQEEQAKARMLLESMIRNYVVAAPSGRTDHANTSRDRETLRAIKVTTANGETDYVEMARLVGYKIRELDNVRSRRNSW